MPMERFLKQYDKEYMKMAMLRHEETFRQQVHELHRLYRVQKRLMRDMKKAELKKQTVSTSTQFDLGRWNAENYSDQRRPQLVLDLEFPPEEHVGKDDGDVMLGVEEENDLELSLAIGSNRRRRKKEETSITSDSGASFSSSSTESGGLKPNSHEWGLYRVPEIGMRFQIERANAFDIQERIRQDGLKQHPWLFQCLSLNMT